ncbi:hypothetical protein [Haploplasma axanthum]|uniref:SGNH/GDSL hydrolase family protein n=1 Tax=Haploplasma axanthum TaxID=29552 RepID=A0A449BE76_HAPAX|nr:hypothetical protein [Haploplasma axanthum]VEU80732.1 Uncharacterised protein [Haploplasma axanthum]
MKNILLIRILKSICFFSIFILITVFISRSFSTRKEAYELSSRSRRASQVFNEPNDSLDVIIVGHSGVYTGYSPMEAYKEYGFTSYSLSQAVQKPWESYNYLVDVLKTQKPKVIVFEVDQLFYDKINYQAHGAVVKAADALFPIVSNHILWKKFFGKKFNPLKERSYTKGYTIDYHVNPYKGPYELKETDKVYKIKKPHYLYMKKVAELCKNNDIPLVLLEMPSKIRWDYSKYNAVKKFADERNIRFVDSNQRIKEFNFDWKNDTRDRGDHLNHYGAVKFTKFFAKYLTDEFDLQNKKDDSKYQHWNNDLLIYENMVEDIKNDKYKNK